MSRSLKDYSRDNWTLSDRKPTDTELTFGVLQRIADATEKMSVNYIQMERDLKYYKDRVTEQNKSIEQLNHTIRGLRSWVTRLKNKL